VTGHSCDGLWHSRLRVPTHRITVGKRHTPPCRACCRWARPKLRPSGGTINYANLGQLSLFGGKATCLMAVGLSGRGVLAASPRSGKPAGVHQLRPMGEHGGRQELACLKGVKTRFGAGTGFLAVGCQSSVPAANRPILVVDPEFWHPTASRRRRSVLRFAWYSGAWSVRRRPSRTRRRIFLTCWKRTRRSDVARPRASPRRRPETGRRVQICAASERADPASAGTARLRSGAHCYGVYRYFLIAGLLTFARVMIAEPVP